MSDTLPRTAFAEPGMEIELATLRSLYEALREVVADFASDLPADAYVEEVELQLDLTERYATPVGHALIAADVAWRIGWLAAEGEENRLGSVDVGSVNLNEILPIEEVGLEIASIEDGSIKAKLLAAKNKISYDSAVATAALLLQFGPMIGINDSTSTEPATMKPIPTKVQEKVERPSEQLPPLPRGTEAITRVTLSNGTIIEFVAADTIQQQAPQRREPQFGESDARQEGDYKAAPVSPEEAAEVVKGTAEFIAAIERLLSN